MITTTHLPPLTAPLTTPPTTGTLHAGSPQRAPAAASTLPAAAGAPAPSAVFIPSARLQAMGNAQTAAATVPVATTAPAAPVSETGLIAGAEHRAQQTADNILGFIGLQLQRDLADGASTEDLSSRILAGLDGFKKGFTEAAEQLSAMGLLSEELKAELQMTYDQVMAGAAEMHWQYAGTELELDPAETGPLASLSTSAPVANQQAFNPSQPTSLDDFSTYLADQLRNQQQGIEALLAYLETMQLEAEPELANRLAEKFTQLAKSFSESGAGEALKEAQALGYSEEEIGLFVQQLAQPSVQRAQQAYGSVQPQAAESDLTGRLQPLVNFARELRDVQDTASRLPQPQDTLMRMTEVVGGVDVGFQRLTSALLNTREV